MREEAGGRRRTVLLFLETIYLTKFKTVSTFAKRLQKGIIK